MPARWPVKVLVCARIEVESSGAVEVEGEVTEYMFMVASAEEVASREPSGENFSEVMPLA